MYEGGSEMKEIKKRICRTVCALSIALSGTVLPMGTPVCAATLLSAEFETTNDSFTGRGAASAAWTSDEAYVGECSLYVSERTDTWNGASRDASSILRAGGTYAVSAAVYQTSGEPVEMKFSLQYTDASGTTAYDAIALETAASGEWTVLSNVSYTVPEGSSDFSIYLETTESLTDFYVDSVTVTGSPSVIKLGDVNGDLSVGVADAVLLTKYLCGETTAIEVGADYNKDNLITAVDLTLLKSALLNPKSPSVSGDWDNYQETASPAMLKVYQDSLLHMGNTMRIRDKISKAQSGENITIGYIGGSITAGGSSSTPSKCFANLSYEYFASTFGCGNNVHYVNAGLAGTSSVVGNLRVDHDIFQKNSDIIFIEFAVNDQGGDRFQKSFESLVKKCLMQENEPAVVIITLCQESGSSNQDWMETVAKNYDVPVVSGKNAIMNAIKAGTMSWKDYGSGDNIHPGDGGHQLIADCIGYYYRQALRSENASDSFEISNRDVFGTEYATARVVDISELKNLQTGSWSKGTNNSGYPNGFTFSKNGNQALSFTVEGKGIMLLFQSNSNSSMGTAVVNVNGKSNKVSSNLQWTWGGLDGDIAYYQNTTGTLDVSITLENPSTNFVLYGIAVIS